jgi:hypothetical protein
MDDHHARKRPGTIFLNRRSQAAEEGQREGPGDAPIRGLGSLTQAAVMSAGQRNRPRDDALASSPTGRDRI